MREIKFRGLTINGIWHYGLLAYTENKTLAAGDTGYFISNKAGAPFAYQIRPETMGEYTGIKDKNGKEIYEGDYLKIETDKGYNFSGEVYFHNCSYCIRFFINGVLLGLIPSVEVLGNIHENPDLIEKG
jgi:hypothetical protein